MRTRTSRAHKSRCQASQRGVTRRVITSRGVPSPRLSSICSACPRGRRATYSREAQAGNDSALTFGDVCVDRGAEPRRLLVSSFASRNDLREQRGFGSTVVTRIGGLRLARVGVGHDPREYGSTQR